jgi:hypothetical protein
MTMRIDLPLVGLGVLAFGATLWFSGGFRSDPPPRVEQLDVVTAAALNSTSTSTRQAVRLESAQAGPVEEVLSGDDRPATLSELTLDQDPDTRVEALTLVALLNEEAADY